MQRFLRKLKDHKISLFFIALSIIVVALVAPMVQKRQDLGSQAAADQASLFFNPSTDSVTEAEKDFPVWVSAEVGVYFARVELNFDPSVVMLSKAPSLINEAFQVIEMTDATTANQTGKIVLVAGLGIGKTAPTGAFQLFSLSFKARDAASGETTVAFDTAGSQLVSETAAAFGLNATPLALAINPVATGATLFFSAPSVPNPQYVQTPFTVDLMLNTAGQEVYGVDAVVQYDRTHLFLTQIEPTVGNGFTSYPVNNINNALGVAKFSSNIGTAVNALAVSGSNVSVARLFFRPLAVSPATSVNYDFLLGERNDSNVILKTSNAAQDPVDVLASVQHLSLTIEPQPSIEPTVTPTTEPTPTTTVTPTGTPSPTVTVTPTPTPGNITVNFSFQGKTRTGVNRNLPISVSYIRDNSGVPSTINLTANNQGQATLSLYPGNYVFVVKPVGYLAKRFGSMASPIVITQGVSTLDFSNVIILGGDLNGDGVVNEVDYTVGFLTNFGLTNPTADLDSSGQVNTLDFAIMRSNWNLTDDSF